MTEVLPHLPAFGQREPYAFYELPFYMALLERFLESGLYDNPDPDDPICEYLQSLLTSPFVMLTALSDKVQGSIFREVMTRFFVTILDRRRFNHQMAQRDMRKNSEALDWSSKQRSDGWQSLFTIMDGYRKYGFDSPFYLKQMQQGQTEAQQDILWEKMCIDWKLAIKNKLDSKMREEIGKRDNALRKSIKPQIRNRPHKMTQRSKR